MPPTAPEVYNMVIAQSPSPCKDLRHSTIVNGHWNVGKLLSKASAASLTAAEAVGLFPPFFLTLPELCGASGGLLLERGVLEGSFESLAALVACTNATAETQLAGGAVALELT